MMTTVENVERNRRRALGAAALAFAAAELDPTGRASAQTAIVDLARG
jgi:hypothetical protein